MNKKFGHLVDGELVFTKLPIRYNGALCYTNDPEIMLAAGQKELVYTIAPTSDDGKYIASWTETDTQLIQEWTFVPYTEAEQERLYNTEIIKGIRETYDLNTELSLLRKYLAYGNLYKSEFEKYNNCVESCKDRAHQKVYKKPYIRPNIDDKYDIE